MGFPCFQTLFSSRVLFSLHQQTDPTVSPRKQNHDLPGSHMSNEKFGPKRLFEGICWGRHPTQLYVDYDKPSRGFLLNNQYNGKYLERRLCPIFKAIVAGFRGKVALKNRTPGVPGTAFVTTQTTQMTWNNSNNTKIMSAFVICMFSHDVNHSIGESWPGNSLCPFWDG